ncbi:MAG: chitobiase/beta-hexosaminidase C-terminal domain-containing protein [Verrucomicrobiota bacterium]
MKKNILTILGLAAGLFAQATMGQGTSGNVTTIGGQFQGYTEGTHEVSQFNAPYGLALNKSGSLYIADYGNNAVRIMRLSDTKVTTLAQGAAAHLFSPVALGFDSFTNLFVLNQGDGTIVKFDAFGNYRGVFHSGLNQPTAMTVETNSNAIFVSELNGRVKRIDNLGFLTVVYNVNNSASRLRGVALLDNGTLIASDAGLNVLWKFNDPFSGPTLYAGKTGVAGRANGEPGYGLLNQPYQIARGPNNSIVIADRGNHKIRVASCAGVLTTLYGINPENWETYPAPGIFPGWFDGTTEWAEVRDPVGVAVDSAGVVYDSEIFYHLVRTGTGLALPGPCDDGGDLTIPTPVLSPNSGFFPDGVTVTVLAANTSGGFPIDTQVYYTIDGTDPDQNSTPVVISNGVGTIVLTGPVDLGKLRVRAFRNGNAGPVIAGKTLSVPLPGISPSSGYFLTNSVVVITNKSDASGLFPAGTKLFYTTDGNDPDLTSTEALITNGIARIQIHAPFNLVSLKVRAFLGTQPGEVAQGQATPFVPNRISFGFEFPQEASSDFVGGPGQRFFAPVTMNIRPGQTMYGLQFGLTITNLAGSPLPMDNYHLNFDSLLMRPREDDPNLFRIIPPATLQSKTITITPLVSGGNVVLITNITLNFSNLISANNLSNILGVGWLERYRMTNLYDTLQQDLITYSMPHDNMYLSKDGKVVPGSFSFVIPQDAKIGDTYRIAIIRASANEDGVSKDVFIEMPDGSDPSVTISAIKTVTVGVRSYIVGDLAPFRWFNAGDFGDGSILNNDLEQAQQSIIYGLNNPPEDSAMYDAIDSCCVDTNGVDLANSFEFWNGNDTVINTIGFGDGKLDIADLYVNFRRAIDPTLVWYARYWSNGVQHADVVPNTFRGSGTFSALSRQSDSTGVTALTLNTAPSPVLPSVRFRAAAPRVNPGQVAAVPIYASISGDYPIRTLLLNLKVRVVDGPVALTQPVTFSPNMLIGAPQFGGNGSTVGYSAAWVDTTSPGLTGEALVGTLYVPVPATASDDTAIQVHFEKASASPNGFGVIPSTTQDGLISMNSRTAVGWNDGIPDAWRIQYFGSLVNLLSAADADADGDGISNRAEFESGTNPTETILKAGQANAKLSLKLPTLPGKKYVLEGSSSFAGTNGWQTVKSNIIGTGDVLEISPSAGSANYQFFRVRVEP